MTADKQRKRAARELAAAKGISYTAALRRLPEHQPEADDVTETVHAWDEVVVDGLSDLVRRGRTIPVRLAGDETGDGREAWGVAEPAVDGYVIRPVASPDRRGLAEAGVQAGARVPVPYPDPAAGDGVTVAALWPLVTRRSGDVGWWWVHNGWPVEAPGDLHETAGPVAPSPDLPYEVRVWHQMPGLLAEDYVGSASAWLTLAWCAAAAAAVELADAIVAHRSEERRAGRDCGFLRAEVHQHAPADRAAVPDRIHQADADPARPDLPRVPFGQWRPGRPAVEIGPEPTWWPSEHNPPNYELTVWTPAEGWRSLGWFNGRQYAAIAATRMRIGVDGAPYPYGATIGPHYPRTWAHDWTQDGRAVSDYHPDMPYAERVRFSQAR